MVKKSNTSARWLVVVTVAFILAITLAPPLQHYFAQRAQINSLRAQVNDSNNALEKAREENLSARVAQNNVEVVGQELWQR